MKPRLSLKLKRQPASNPLTDAMNTSRFMESVTDECCETEAKVVIPANIKYSTKWTVKTFVLCQTAKNTLENGKPYPTTLFPFSVD